MRMDSRQVTWNLNCVEKLNENEKGSPYWITDISDGERQYTSNTPRDCNSVELVKRICLYINLHQTMVKTTKRRIKGEVSWNQEYVWTIN